MDEKQRTILLRKIIHSYQIVSGKQGVPNRPPYNMLTAKKTKKTNTPESQTFTELIETSF